MVKLPTVITPLFSTPTIIIVSTCRTSISLYLSLFKSTTSFLKLSVSTSHPANSKSSIIAA